MFLSFFASKIDAGDDNGLAEYLNEIETRIKGGDIAEQFVKGHKGLLPAGAWTSIYWDVECYGINKYFEKFGVKKKAQWAEVSLVTLNEKLQASPLIFGTKLTAGGHIILITGREPDNYIINDPYGNYMKGYADRNGESVRYPASVILSTGSQATKQKNKLRIMWAV
jgi:hypothetical protein